MCWFSMIYQRFTIGMGYPSREKIVRKYDTLKKSTQTLEKLDVKKKKKLTKIRYKKRKNEKKRHF